MPGSYLYILKDVTPDIMTSEVPGDSDRQQSLGTTDFKVKGYWLQRPNYSHKEKWLQK